MILEHTIHIQKPSVDRYKSKLKHHKQVDYSLLCVMYTIVPCMYMTGPTNNSVERDCQGFGCQPLRYWEQTGYRGTKWSLKRLKDQLLLLWHKGNSRGELLSSLTEVNLFTFSWRKSALNSCCWAAWLICSRQIHAIKSKQLRRRTEEPTDL